MGHVCPVCDEVIRDDTKSQKGQDSIWCEGECNTWLHRGCAGLSKKRFIALRESSESFSCVSCRLSAQSMEIRLLCDDVKLLKEAFVNLKWSLSSEVQAPSTNRVNKAVTKVSSEARSTDTSSTATLHSPTTGSSPHSGAANSESMTVAQFNNRNLNVVVSGIPERQSDISRKQRWLQDLKEVTTLFTESQSILASSIVNCRRLGKFSVSNTRPRPILVHFNSCSVVVEILSRRSSFLLFIVKPDLSPTERANERLLLKERWKLIQEGVNKSGIKIKGAKLFVEGTLFGYIKDLAFLLYSGGKL